MTWFKNLITEGDGESHCPVRVGGVAVWMVYHAGLAWMVIGQHASIDAALLGQYIQHQSMLLGTTALGVGAKALMKADAAPDPGAPPTQ